MAQVWGHGSWRQLSYTIPVSGWDAAFWGFALPEEPASLCWGWKGFCGHMEQETLVERVAQWPRNSDTGSGPLTALQCLSCVLHLCHSLLASAGLNCFLR